MAEGMKVGVVGIGDMGMPILGSYVRAGHDVTAFPAPIDLRGCGPAAAGRKRDSSPCGPRVEQATEVE